MKFSEESIEKDITDAAFDFLEYNNPNRGLKIECDHVI